ncbi:MAG TPA: DUF2079 domain-containing protein [Candidatus Bathyarchaeia archaeon]|nr:DUF2079 domain-containing protein [Candidatus Bathyarchaeia archaeon]
MTRLGSISFDSIEEFLSAKSLGRERSELILLISVFAYTLAFSLYTIAHHATFNTFAWDLGIYNQALWSTAFSGKFFYYTCELYFVQNGSFFGIHFAPILLFLLPLYYLFPSPEFLLSFQSLILALGAIPLYFLCKLKLNRGLGIVFSLSYLLYPPLQGVNSYDFHVQAFFPFLMLSAVYYLEKRDWKYFIFLILSLMVIEQVSYLVIFLGIYVLWAFRKRIVSAIRTRKTDRAALIFPFVTILSGVMWIFLAGAVINQINPDIPPELRAAQNFIVLGVDDPAKIPIYALLHPLKVFEALRFDFNQKFSYLLMHFAPLVFLPVIEPGLLIATLPWFGISLLSNYIPYYQIGFQYSAIVIPFIFASAVLGTRKLLGRELAHGKIMKRMAHLLILCSLVFSISLSPLSPLIQGNFPSNAYNIPVMTSHSLLLHDVIRMIPQNASILTQDNIFPHVSNRLDAYVIVPQIQGDTPFWQKAASYIKGINTTYVLIDLKSNPGAGTFLLQDAVDKRIYGLYVYIDGIMLFKANYNGNPVLFQPIDLKYNYTNLKVGSGGAAEDPTSTSKKVLILKTSDPHRYAFWFGPYETLPSGNYSATFRMKVGSLTEGRLILLDIIVGADERAARYILGSDFTEANTWMDIIIPFTLEKPVINIEFRGVEPQAIADIYLDYIKVVSTDVAP